MKKAIFFKKVCSRLESRTSPGTRGKQQDTGIVIAISALVTALFGIRCILRTYSFNAYSVPESGPDHGSGQGFDPKGFSSIHKVLELGLELFEHRADTCGIISGILDFLVDTMAMNEEPATDPGHPDKIQTSSLLPGDSYNMIGPTIMTCPGRKVF